jgi:hypothetical protein
VNLEGRINRLEASLTAREKFSLWFHRAKAAGGFAPYWERELAGPFAPFEWFEDEEAYFLFTLVNDLNFTILNNASKNQDLRFYAHCALDGILRRICRLNKTGVFVPVRPIPEIAMHLGKNLCAKFRSLLEETELIAAAIVVISETYLRGEDILFSDTRATLDAEVCHLRTTADIFDPLTYWLKIEPLTLNKQASDSPIVQAKVDSVVNLARANALVGCSDLRKFKDALERAFP